MRGPVRVLVLGHNLASELYGAELSLLGVLDRIDRARFEPAVVTPFAGPLFQRARERGLRTAALFPGPLPARWFPRLTTILFLGQPRIRRLIEALGADLVYGHETLAPVLAAIPAGVARVPFVYSPRTSFSDAPRKHRLAILAAARAGVAALLAPSGAVERSFGALPAPVRRVIYPGVDVARFDAAARSEALRARCGAATGDLLFAVVGRVTEPKGQLDFVRAAAAVLAKEPRARFAIVGDAPGSAAYLARIEAEIARLGLAGRMALPGYVADAAALMRSLDVVCVPSGWEEAIARVAIEAASAGRPVVASRVGGLPESVADGESGLLFPRGDVGALAGAMLRLARDPALRARMGSTGRRIASEKFGLDRCAREVEAAFDEVLRAWRRGAGRPIAGGRP